MKQRPQRVLVVGGGIGGLSAAAALGQIGCEVDLIESKAAWTTLGVGLIQPTNALNALARIGAAEDCLQRGFAYPGYRWLDESGHLMREVPGPRIGALPAYNGIRRGDLHHILLGRAQAAGATITMNRRVEELKQRPQAVEVRFNDGTQQVYDFVVGADGIYSDMRRRLFGEVNPRMSGQSTWRVMLPKPTDLQWGVMAVASHRKAGLIPLSKQDMYLLLVTEEPGHPALPVHELNRLLRERLSVFDGLIAELVPLITDDSPIVYRPMEIVMLPAPWHVGRVLLIGDAAHASTPHLGQGAAMAIEDAVVLADVVSKGLPWAAAVSEYMTRRFARANLIQSASLKLGEYEQGHLPDLDVFGLMSEVKIEATSPI